MNDKYVALDVHSATTSACIRDAAGFIRMEATVETSAKELVSLVRAIPGTVHLTFEEGPQAAWLYDLLQPHVHRLVVCDPRKNRLINEGSKSDAIDARKLSELLRLGSLKPIYHGEHGTRALKELVYAHLQLVEDTVRTKNRIKARFRSRGIRVTGQGIYNPANRQEWLSKLDRKANRQRAEWLYAELERLEELRREAEKALIAESRKHRGTRLLRDVPGIGAIRAAQIVGLVDTPHRFRTKRQFWSYIGLAVIHRSSADWEIGPGGMSLNRRCSTRGLNRNFNRVLKAVFKMAAVDAIRGAYRSEYEKRVEAGMRPAMARLAVARKIAAICLTLWKTGARYEQSKAVNRAA